MISFYVCCRNEFYASDLSVCFAQDISDGLKHDMKSENSNSTDTYAEEIKEILSTEKCDVDVSNSDCANCHITTSSGGEAVHANNPQKAAVLSDMKDAAKNKRKALIKYANFFYLAFNCFMYVIRILLIFCYHITEC